MQRMCAVGAQCNTYDLSSQWLFERKRERGWENREEVNDVNDYTTVAMIRI